ncbi:hypothetical protein Tco_1285786 [Tanacetum coccineum]
MNESVNDGIKLSKLEINSGFINGLPKKWLSFCQSLRNTNHVKDYELASLFGKLKYEENLIDSIYDTKKKKALTTATPLSTPFISTYIVQDLQDSPDDEEDTRSSQEYLNDLEEEYQARTLLAKSKRLFKKATEETLYQKCDRKGHFARDCFSKTLVPSFSSPFQNNTQPRFTSPSQHKPEMRPNKDFKAKYNKVKARLALLKVSSDDNEVVEVKVLMALVDDERVVVGKKSARNDELVKISMRKLSEAEGFIFPNHDTGKILPAESQVNTIDPSVAVPNSSASEYDSADESSVYSTPLPLLEKLVSAEPISGPKTIKLILKSNSTFKAESLKDVIINDLSSAHVKAKASVSKTNSALAGKIKNVKTEDGIPLASVHFSKKRNQAKKPYVIKSCETYGSTVHTTTDHNDIEWFRRGEALQAKKVEALESKKTESSTANRSKTLTKSGCLRHMTGVKSYLPKYEEWPGPKVVFGDDSTCTTEGYGSINVMFDEKRGAIFNFNKEIMMITPRLRDVYVLNMTSSAQESCFFAKAFENLN